MKRGKGRVQGRTGKAQEFFCEPGEIGIPDSKGLSGISGGQAIPKALDSRGKERALETPC